MNLLTMVYEQQRIMYDANTHGVPDRIVNLSQPYVRPIPRGKAKAKTEFGAKLHISMVNGYARIERLSFDAYNEAEDFFHIVEDKDVVMADILRAFWQIASTAIGKHFLSARKTVSTLLALR